MTVWMALGAVLVGDAPAAMPDPDDCFGRFDYSDELLVDPSRAVTTRAPLQHGFVRLTFAGLTLENTSIGDFARTSVTPRLDAIGVRSGRITPAVGGALPTGTSQPLGALVMDVPIADEALVVSQITSGAVPFAVYAAEVPQLAPGVELLGWTEELDDAYAEASAADPKVNADPGKGPWARGASFVVTLAFDDGVPAELSGLGGGPAFLVVDEFVPEAIPQPLHYLVVDDVDREDDDGTDVVTLSARLADDVDLRDVFRAATVCSTVGLDNPVRVTPNPTINGQTVDVLELETSTQPLWFRETDLFGGLVTLSGQFHMQALVPQLAIRIRDGVVESEVGLESEISLSGQVEARLGVADREELPLPEVCYPLPDLQLGFGLMSQGLCVEPVIYVKAQLGAGVKTGIAKRLTSGVTLRCVWEPGPSCALQTAWLPDDPLSISPPEIRDDVGGSVEIGAELNAFWTLRARVQPPVLSVDVGIESEAYGTFASDLTETPWWTLSHGARLGAHATIEAFDRAAVNWTMPILAPDPTIVLSASGGAAGRWGATPRYRSGEDVRWMVSLDQPDAVGELPEDVDVALLSGGDVLVTAAQAPGHRLVGLDRYGSLQWTQGYASGFAPREVVALPDDTVMVLSAQRTLAAHEPTGALRWATTYDLETDAGSCALRGMEAVTTLAGEERVVLVGVQGTGLTTEADACVGLVDAADGSVVWARSYERPGRQGLEGVVGTRDGDLVVVGTDEADGWMMRLDPAGEPRWSVVAQTAGARGGELFDVAEGPTGRLVAVGMAGREIRHNGSAYVVSVEADGSDLVNGYLFHNAGGGGLGPEPSVLASDTPGDPLHEVIAVDDAFVVVGHTGAYGETGWIARISERLGVEWFTALDGETGGELTGLARREDALVVAGTSAATGTVPGGAERAIVVATVPFDGNFEVHPAFPYVQTPLLTGSVVDAFTTYGLGGSAAQTSVATRALVTSERAEDRLLQAPERECAMLMTPTGRPTADGGCVAQPDLWPPLVAIVQPQATIYGASMALTPVVEVSDEPGGSELYMDIDGVDWPLDEPLVFGALGVGEHVMTVEATDPSGNVGWDQVVFEVVDDGSPPPDAEEDADDDDPTGRCGCASPTPVVGAGAWLLVLAMLRRRRLAGS